MRLGTRFRMYFWRALSVLAHPINWHWLNKRINLGLNRTVLSLCYDKLERGEVSEEDMPQVQRMIEMARLVEQVGMGRDDF